MMITKQILFLMLVLLLVTPIHAENIGTFKVNESFEITNFCSSGDCTYMNLSSITTPSGQLVQLDAVMTQSNQNFNYSYTPTEIGDYSFITCADPDSELRCEKDEFTITQNGHILTTAKIIAYIVIFIVAILVMIGLVGIGLMLPDKNKTDEKYGYIIAVSALKYARTFFFCFSYLVALLIAFFAYSISKSYLEMNYLTNLLRTLFIIEVVIAFVGFPLVVYFTITKIIQDSKVKEALLYNIRIK